jgi:DNA-binding transcriptional LysR family regulator
VSGTETYAAAGLAGFGLIQVPRYRFEAELASGPLRVVLPNNPPTPLPVSLLYPRAKHLSPRLRVFIDWAVEAFREAR